MERCGQVCNLLNSQKVGAVYSDFLILLFSNGQKLQISDIDEPLAERRINVLRANLIAEFRNFGFDIAMPKEKIKSWKNLLDLALEELIQLEKANLTYLGVKITKETYFLSELMDKYFKVIYIYRDPRDVLLSAKNRFVGYNYI